MPNGIDERLFYSQMHGENVILAKTTALQFGENLTAHPYNGRWFAVDYY
jgi:hypothetical protein